MDMGKYKDIVQGILKDYSSLLLPIVIGLVGALLFVPTRLINSRLRTRIEAESVRQGNTLQSLLRNPVAPEQWKEERDYQQAHRNDANDIEFLARQSSKRGLLSYMVFPEPKDSSTQIFTEFGKQLRTSLEELLARINARDCPTDVELDASLQRASVGSPARRRFSYRKSRGVGASIRDDLCRIRAQSASVYASPANLGGYEFWAEFKYAEADSWEEAIRECWYSQLGNWIIEDIVDTIATVNGGSNSVFTSPVKRLMYVDFSMRGIGYSYLYARASRHASTTQDERPTYVLSREDGIVVPCTGRISNADIDVVHFKLSVLVTPQTLLPFMQELCSAKTHRFAGWQGTNRPQEFKHNQITILEYEVSSVDPDDTSHQLYRYGDDAVVRLDLVCEYIFDKLGYDEVKPKAVKDHVEETRTQLQQRSTRGARRARRRSSTGTGGGTRSRTGSRRRLREMERE
ncbi:MAG: hypothetical protein ACYTEQ_09570 [Planctomycetota bacterium]|jgi:hypothetical protein